MRRGLCRRVAVKSGAIAAPARGRGGRSVGKLRPFLSTASGRLEVTAPFGLALGLPGILVRAAADPDGGGANGVGEGLSARRRIMAVRRRRRGSGRRGRHGGSNRPALDERPECGDFKVPMQPIVVVARPPRAI